jgi:hypothetical protein
MVQHLTALSFCDDLGMPKARSYPVILSEAKNLSSCQRRIPEEECVA